MERHSISLSSCRGCLLPFIPSSAVNVNLNTLIPGDQPETIQVAGWIKWIKPKQERAPLGQGGYMDDIIRKILLLLTELGFVMMMSPNKT